MVYTGLAVLVRDGAGSLRGRRAGLVTHAAAVLPDFTPAASALASSGVELAALFSLEHGYSGAGADGMPVADARDPLTGLPIHSLFGTAPEPSSALLDVLDVLVYDVQDVGARFYTFISSLYHLMRAAARHEKPVVVLDRPNPATGRAVEGPLVDPGCASFFGVVPIPIRYGLTPGELAHVFNGEFGCNAELTVIPMEGWRREMWFDDTGLPWVPPSPAMPHLSTSEVYPGACLLEGTNLSVGRGTGLPFEQFGAPWVDSGVLADALNGLGLPGVRFRPTSFEPARRYDPRWGGDRSELCHGVQIHVVDRAALRPVRMGLHILAALRRLYPDDLELTPHLDLLTGSRSVRGRLGAGEPAASILQEWEVGEEDFRYRRRAYLLYE